MIAPTPTRPIIENDLMTQEFQKWTREVSGLIYTGNGVPDFNAVEGSLYTDLDGTTGARLYSMGAEAWILV